MKRSYTKQQKKLLYTLAAIAVVICLVVELIGMIPGVPFNGWSDIGIALGLTPSPVIPEGELEVHFLDVGNADCILVRQGDKTMLIDAGEEERDRLDNLEEFKSGVIEYCRTAEEPTLTGFLEENALVADVDRYDDTADAVVMMTVHSAKGLEFPIVFLPGMEDGIFPGMQTITGGNDEMEEERRLAYVAITRAKRELLMLHVRTRLLYGSTTYNPVSRFVSEIPESLLAKEDMGANAHRFDVARQPQKPAKKYIGLNDDITVGKPLGHAASAPTTGAFAAGDRVRHPIFGEGVILSTKPMAADTLLEVAFDRVGTKKLMATYAKLKKI